ncbi:tetratricopeptide repeat protein [Cohnella sp. AR92]|uniref:tetratricopeptide repeat protein n=1 Tax=Cohnella sp. AR92 TaxID=648716 RepID=UPI000F8DAC9C|nr:tetratricopeptide repeat protein [Cohnella sp. AR92]RUS47131.1 tetratricopeptide repeat protein [Cohnella sp. AR92]
MNKVKAKRYRFSEAPIWELLRQYYEELGLQAWRNDQVPQYITSNPMIGTAYAEMIFGVLQDLAARKQLDEPVQIVELGAGAGRLAKHILHSLNELVQYAGIPLPPYRYLMTDLVADNVAGWRRHSALQEYVSEGVLDFARFDAVYDEELRPVVSGESIREGQFSQPLIVVANYFFDSLPQELIYVGDGDIYECDVEIEIEEGSSRKKAQDAIAAVELSYNHRRAPEYESPDYRYRDILTFYREEMEDSHILFPEASLRCLERLQALSQEGFILLTADKGDHLADNWRFLEPPKLVVHGSFSLTANYHAINHVFESRGGQALFTEHHYKNLNVGCLLAVQDPASFANTRLAYRRSVENFGPDDFFSLKLWADKQIEDMHLQQLLAFWRLGRYDAEWFAQSGRRISTLMPEATDEEKLDLQLGIRRMWSSYYVLEQKYDLALDIGMLLFEMDQFEESRRYLEDSVAAAAELPDPMVYYCLAICCLEQEDNDRATEYLKQALEQEPDHEEARELLNALAGEGD